MAARAWLLLLTLGATWGAVYPLTTIALRDLPTLAVVASRSALAAAVLLPLAARSRPGRHVRQRLRSLLVAALLQATIPLVLLTAGQQHVAASLAGILSATQPVFVALLAWAMAPADRPTWRQHAGIALAFAGTALLVVHAGGGRSTTVGALGVLGSAIFFAAGAVWIHRRLPDTPPILIAAAAMTVTTVALAPAALTAAHHLTTAPLLALLALGTVGTGLALAVYYALIRDVGPTRASLAFYLAPAFAVLYGVTLLDEHLTTDMIVGLGLVTVGSVLAAQRPAIQGDQVRVR